MGNNLYSIGDFSRLCRLSVKALRLYDRQGFFRPGHTDSRSGYRYYSSAQLSEAILIRRLRLLDMSLEDIAFFLRERDPEARRRLLEQHGRRIEERLEGYRSIAASLENMLEDKEEVMKMEIVIKELAPQPVVSCRFKTPLSNIGPEISAGFGRVFGYLGSLGEFPSGPPFALYGEYNEDEMDVEVCAPTVRVLDGTEEVKGYRLDGGRFASTMHAGPYEEVGNTWDAIMEWIDGNGYQLTGPCREVYLVGPEQSQDPDEYRTEIICPVESI